MAWNNKSAKTTPCTVDGGCKINGLGGGRDEVRVGRGFGRPKNQETGFVSPLRRMRADGNGGGCCRPCPMTSRVICFVGQNRSIVA